jgi:Fels-1 Prophage Protein-like
MPEMFLRSCAMAIAAVALAGCASGYAGDYDYYPGEAYYDGPYYPYYGGVFGYDSHDYNDHDRYFHPARGVTCDRARDICYDRYGVSYHDTARHLGERDANRAYDKYGDKVFLFSPSAGVTCDRRTQSCSNGQWKHRADGDAPDRARRIQPGNKGSIGARPRFADDDEPFWPVPPTRRDNDRAVNKRISPPVQARPQRLVDNDDIDVARPSARATSDHSDRPAVRPRLNSGDKPSSGGGNACPPLGCN